jgi:cell wall assembly regulator SMI1
MQKFTRALTREIEVAGERLAVTLSEKGLSVRPVGSRRPPYEMSWAAWICACTAPGQANYEPTAEEAEAAVQTMKAGKVETPKAEKPAEPEAPAPAPTGPLAGLPERLGKWLSAHRAHYLKALLSGATADQMEALHKEIGVPVPEELGAWLTWHNGQDPNVVGAVAARWIPMSTTEIAEAKKELDANPKEGWQKTWVPFLDDDNGNYLCLDTSQLGHPVREYREGHPENKVVAPSLKAWLEKFVTGVENGEYHEDSERGTFFHKASGPSQ